MDLGYILSENNSGIIGPDYLQKNAGKVIPYLVLLTTSTVVGSIGNLLVIGAITTSKELRQARNAFILNLALADFCVTSFVDPFSIIGVIEGEVYFLDKWWLCETVASVCLTSCFCSLLSIGAISFNRYVHIVHNAQYQRIYTVRNCILMCIGLWIVSFLLEMSNFLGWGDHTYDRKNLACIWDRTADLSYTIFFSGVGVAVPLVIISLCYLKIYLYVRASKRRVHQATDVKTSARQRKETQNSLKFARTLFIIFVAFMVCWSPYAIVVAVDVHDRFSAEVHTYVLLFAHMNSSVNSILYGVTNKHFWRAYKRLLLIKYICACLPKKRNARSTMPDGGLTFQTGLETTRNIVAVSTHLAPSENIESNVSTHSDD